jgi:hypothetical protein
MNIFAAGFTLRRYTASDKKQPSRPLVMFDITIDSDYGRERHMDEAAIAAADLVAYVYAEE